MGLRFVFLLLLFGLCYGDVANIFKRGAGPSLGNGASDRIYCGKHLAQTLSTVCQGNYNTLTKKNDNFYTNFFNQEQGGVEYPYMRKTRAASVLGRRRRRRGVTNECCDKPCSVHELSSYCA